jgi:hypothetical protein
LCNLPNIWLDIASYYYSKSGTVHNLSDIQYPNQEEERRKKEITLAMSDEQATIAQVMTQLTEMRREIISLKSALTAAITATSETDNPARLRQTNHQPVAVATSTSRRRMLKKLGASAMLTGLVATTAGLASQTQTQTAHAEVISNPTGNVGAIITPKGTTVTGTMPTNRKFGLLATANAALDLSTLTGGPMMAAIFGQGRGGLAGVLGTSDTNIGVFARSSSNDGVHALSDTGKAIYARSTNGDCALHAVGDGGSAIIAQSSRFTPTITATNPQGSAIEAQTTISEAVNATSTYSTAVLGKSVSGTGVHGYSQAGTALSAYSQTGIPLYITPGAEPTTGERKVGQIYMDAEGNLHVYTKNGWQQVVYYSE